MTAPLALVRPGERLDQLAAMANAAHRETLRNAVVAGQALLEAKRLLPHGGWRGWVKAHCIFSLRSAQEYMQVASNARSSALSIKQALAEIRHTSRFTFCAADIEWYTPSAIVEASRQALGGQIDLDPASCEVANRVVRARKIYTLDDDALRHKWRGRIFMNPPYSITLIPRFIAKLVQHVKDGSVIECVVLVNSATEVRWFHEIAGIARAGCFLVGRVRFWKPGQGTEVITAQGVTGQSILYIGSRPRRFARAFRPLGRIWVMAHEK